MGARRSQKLNRLVNTLPDGLLVDAAWLGSRGYSSALRSKYVRHGWLEQVVRGVYRRPVRDLRRQGDDAALRWQEVLVSLQALLGARVALGGRSALEQQGFAHYLPPAGGGEVHVYGREALPTWVTKLNVDRHFVWHNAKRLFGTEDVPTRELSTSEPAVSLLGLVRRAESERDGPLVMSSPERAILEVLNEVPRRETFHQADVLMEGLATLSPKRLQRLLGVCRSVKVKRLFFWFADRHQHAWLKKLDRKAVDLGRGKRSLVDGGKLDPTYHITVPGDLDAH